MRLPPLPLLAALACSRRSPPPAPQRPVVMPERVGDAGPAARPATAAPPAPVEGPCSLALPGGAEVTGLSGRIDRLQIAASGDSARLVAELSGPGAPSRASTVSVDVTAAGVASPPVTVSVGARATRVIATAVAHRGGLRTLAYGVRRTEIGAADFGNTHRFVLEAPGGAAVRSEPQLLDVDEIVAASDGERLAAATSGGALECYGTTCEPDDRQYSGFAFHPRSGYAASVVLAAGGAVRRRVVAGVDCPEPSADESGGDPTLVEAGSTPAERCGGVRRQRPYDVAVAVRGGDTFVAFRDATTVRGVAVSTEGAPLGPPQVLATGEVGAPAVAFRGDAVVVVWAQRDNARAPYSLRVVEWDRAASPQPPAPRVLATGAVSAFAPSLATVGVRRVLAWMEGDDRNAVVRVAGTALGVEHLADHAVTVSAPTDHARDPELAVSGDRAWIAWSEYAAGQRRDQGRGRVRVSPLRLP